MSAEERLIRYCSIDTESDPESDTSPSTARQYDLARLLQKELTELGMSDVRLDEENGYVYAHLDANIEEECRTVGFIAHMDTAPDFSGANVHPRVIRDYDGGDIQLNEEITTRVEDFPYMKALKGKTLIVTDGNSLLGGDDKAGITAIMEALCYLKAHPEVKHGRIAVAFTPDEEIGRGTDHFDIPYFGADFAYTMDGGPVNVYNNETFNAAAAVVKVNGVSIHPGSAKNKMINALNAAYRFHGLLPEHMRPEHTEGWEPFFHMTNLRGSAAECEMHYIIRTFDADQFRNMQQMMKDAAAYVNETYGKPVIDLTITETYRNMKEILVSYPEITAIAEEAIRDMGYTPVNESVRGGTDGAMLTFKGLPCPNLGTGDGNCHGRYEYVVLEEMEAAADLIVRIVQKVSGRK